MLMCSETCARAKPIGSMAKPGTRVHNQNTNKSFANSTASHVRLRIMISLTKPVKTPSDTCYSQNRQSTPFSPEMKWLQLLPTECHQRKSRSPGRAGFTAAGGDLLQEALVACLIRMHPSREPRFGAWFNHGSAR